MTTLYRSPNVLIEKHEWHAAVKVRDKRTYRRFYFRPAEGPRRMWLPITSWKGHRPTAAEFAVFKQFERHMLMAERSVRREVGQGREVA